MVLSAIRFVLCPVVVEHSRRFDTNTRQSLALQNRNGVFFTNDATLKQRNIAITQRVLNRSCKFAALEYLRHADARTFARWLDDHRVTDLLGGH